MQNYRHKVQYYETDQMGIVHHSNYIRWFEEARIDHLEKAGMGFAQIEAEGVLSPVLAVTCEYKSMTRFGENVEIALSIKKYNGVKLELSYSIKDVETQEIRAEGTSTHCFMNKEGQILALKRACPRYHEILSESE